MGYFPKRWKIAWIRIIRKANKESYVNPKNFRPISVLNTLCKIFEKIILRRLTWLSINQGWISERQHGFRENRSTETAAHTLISFVEKSFSKGNYAAAAFLDISGAFDSAWPPAIIQSLSNKGCPHYLTCLINSFLKDRTAILSNNDYSIRHNISIGCPQGSVLSPFLWNILIDNLVRNDFPFPYEFVAFADDWTLLTTDKDPERATKNLQTMVTVISKDCQKILVDISAEKTGLMIFNRKRLGLPDLNITVNNNLIFPVQQWRFLGLELDPKLK